VTRQPGRSWSFETNNVALPAPLIALLYKPRLKVELFFNGSSRHCAINTVTAPPQRVKTPDFDVQRCLCLGGDCEKALKSDVSYRILQILSITLLSKRLSTII